MPHSSVRLNAIIDQILIDDETAPPKQRHTAAQVFRRLRDEHGYRGGYGQVQRYLLKHRRRQRETFIPLGHLPGQRLEADFGHIYVDFPEGRRQIPFLVTPGPTRTTPFVLALPFERTEAILEGMVTAFEFFGCVPKEVWWDNPKTVATLILLGVSGSSIPATRHWPVTTPSIPASACRLAATRSPMPRAPSRPCNAASPPRCPESKDLDELNVHFSPAVRSRADANRAVALRPVRDRHAVRRGTERRRARFPSIGLMPA